MAKEYVKLWLSYEAYFEPLSAAEVGRLTLAMMKYKSQGVEPVFAGNERFVWPAIKRDIDEANQSAAEYSAKQSENGKNGGRPKKALENEKATETQKTQAFFEKPKKDMDNGLRTKDNIPPISPSGDISPQRGEPTAEKRKRFVAPSVDEVRAYCKERGNRVDPQRFVDFYTANGWTQGRGKPIKDWRAAVRTWEARDKQTAPAQRPVLTDDDYDLDKFF